MSCYHTLVLCCKQIVCPFDSEFKRGISLGPWSKRCMFLALGLLTYWNALLLLSLKRHYRSKSISTVGSAKCIPNLALCTLSHKCSLHRKLIRYCFWLYFPTNCIFSKSSFRWIQECEGLMKLLARPYLPHLLYFCKNRPGSILQVYLVYSLELQWIN